MSKEQMGRREFITKGLLVTAGLITEAGVIVNLTQLEGQLSNEASRKYPSVTEKCGVAANPAGLSCRRVVESNERSLSRSEESEIVQQYRDFRMQLVLENNGVPRVVAGIAAGLAGALSITQGLSE